MRNITAIAFFIVLAVIGVSAARADCTIQHIINAGGGVQVWQYCCDNGVCTWTRLA